jgi:IclR family acetate operon transcriptional repressor
MTTTLRRQGLTRETTDGLQALGPRVLVLARGFLGGLDFRVEALPVLSELREVTGETCHLGTLAAPHIVYVDKLDAIHPVRVASRIGGTRPAVSTALGRAILASSDPRVIAGVIEATRRQLDIDVDVASLERLLAVTRARGYGLDLGESLPGVCCVGAPVFDDAGTVIAGISVSIPTERFDRQAVHELGQRVRAAADRISAALGLEPLLGARLDQPGHDEVQEDEG